MPSLPRPPLVTLPAILALAAALSAGCSVQQTTDRCASESASLSDLITCVRKKHAATQRCDALPKGRAAAPVSGRRILKFGDTTNYGGTSKGMVFGTSDRAAVHAPVSGTVTFADPFRSYGDLVIVDACTKVALLAGTFSPNVIAGEPIAAGDAVALMRKISAEDPVLYLELREEGKAVDPAGLLPAE
ncbi:MAG: murein hydrolase activator EnvC [Hyphomicrobium sp.]|uniref:murein hydrolase activator EnvC family protein n=1 Tax=Hyphomicrobium sp. TaxID=82 RepID=UPI003D11994C